jgi:hypothetical protein
VLGYKTYIRNWIAPLLKQVSHIFSLLIDGGSSRTVSVMKDRKNDIWLPRHKEVITGVSDSAVRESNDANQGMADWNITRNRINVSNAMPQLPLHMFSASMNDTPVNPIHFHQSSNDYVTSKETNPGQRTRVPLERSTTVTHVPESLDSVEMLYASAVYDPFVQHAVAAQSTALATTSMARQEHHQNRFHHPLTDRERNQSVPHSHDYSQNIVVNTSRLSSHIDPTVHKSHPLLNISRNTAISHSVADQRELSGVLDITLPMSEPNNSRNLSGLVHLPHVLPTEIVVPVRAKAPMSEAAVNCDHNGGIRNDHPVVSLTKMLDSNVISDKSDTNINRGAPICEIPTAPIGDSMEQDGEFAEMKKHLAGM